VNGRLLLVDDDPDIREVARLSLERIGGWSVVDAESADAAERKVAAEGPFAAVLLDVMMPGADGPATLRRLRDGALAPDVPIIFLTAKAQRGDRERLEALGAAGVIPKPFDPVTLPNEVAAILGAAI
jgi:CheY-like chemotaxis protein